MTNGPQALPVGHELKGYTIQEVLGQGGFGMTYLATDTNLDRQVAIKEYLPTMFASRNEDFTVNPLTENHEDDYNWGLSSFLTEARTLAQFKHRNIVQVLTVFKAYDTAYMVMEYEHGESLEQVFKSRLNQLDQQFFEGLLFPVMDGLQAIHDTGFIHRDIKPGNLYIRTDGSPVLIDFGSARQTSQQETSEMTTLVSQGYTPIEQYSANYGEQGPWTDIYSFAASVYHGVTGSRPEDALNRSASLISATKPDPLTELSTLRPEGFSDTFCFAVDTALKLKPEDRPQSLATWRETFDTSSAVTASVPPYSANTNPNDDDATRLLPRSQHTTQPGAQTGLRPAAHRYPQPMEFDTGPTTTTATGNREATHRPVASKPGQTKSTMPLIAGGLLAVALGAGGWWLTQKNADQGPTIIVTAQLLDELPRPSNAAGLPAPLERIETEIAESRILASVYDELLQADPDSGQGKEGMSFLLQNYRSIAELSLVQSSDTLRSKLSAALRTIAPHVNTSDEIEELISELGSTDSSLSFDYLETLVEKEALSNSEQEQLLYGLSSLPAGEKAKALADSRVAKLSNNFKKSIIKAVKANQFERARNMTALALLVSPDDNELNMLKDHLENDS